MISMLTGSNPFYREPRRLQEASEYEVPDFIIERVLMEEIEWLEEERYHPALRDATVKHGEEHSSVSKHIHKYKAHDGAGSWRNGELSKRAKQEKEDWHNHSKSVKEFRGHVDNIVNSHKKEHGTHPTADHISKELSKRMNKKSVPSGRGPNGENRGGSIGRTQRNLGLHHTHVADNKNHGPKSSYTHDHMIHWRVHPKTNKVHITGISRHNEKDSHGNVTKHIMNQHHDMVERRGSMDESIKALQRRLEELLSE